MGNRQFLKYFLVIWLWLCVVPFLFIFSAETISSNSFLQQVLDMSHPVFISKHATEHWNEKNLELNKLDCHDNTGYLQEELCFSEHAGDDEKWKECFIPTETWISVFNLQIKKIAAMQMLLPGLGENCLPVQSQNLPVTSPVHKYRALYINTLIFMGLTERVGDATGRNFSPLEFQQTPEAISRRSLI